MKEINKEINEPDSPAVPDTSLAPGMERQRDPFPILTHLHTSFAGLRGPKDAGTIRKLP